MPLKPTGANPHLQNFVACGPPSNTPIARPTPLTTLNGIRIQSAVLPQYPFWTHRPTDGINDSWIPWAYTLAILTDSNAQGKTNLNFTQSRDTKWQWHQLCHMQPYTSSRTDNHATISPLTITTTRKHTEYKPHDKCPFQCGSIEFLSKSFAKCINFGIIIPYNSQKHPT